MIAETDRLLISEFSVEDAPFFLELVNTPKWLKFIGDRKIHTIEQAEDRIKQGHLDSYKTHGFGFYKLLLKSEGNKPIGTCGFVKRVTLEHPDIGFAMLPDYEQKGFGYESAAKLLDLADSKFNLKTVLGITLPNNEASIKLLEKLGLTYQRLINPFDDDKELMLFQKIIQ